MVSETQTLVLIECEIGVQCRYPYSERATWNAIRPRVFGAPTCGDENVAQRNMYNDAHGSATVNGCAAGKFENGTAAAVADDGSGRDTVIAKVSSTLVPPRWSGPYLSHACAR